MLPLRNLRNRFKSRRPAQFRRVGRLQRVDEFDRLGLNLPLEEPQHDLVCREIGKEEPMLLDWLDLLLEIENR